MISRWFNIEIRGNDIRQPRVDSDISVLKSVELHPNSRLETTVAQFRLYFIQPFERVISGHLGLKYSCVNHLVCDVIGWAVAVQLAVVQLAGCLWAREHSSNGVWKIKIHKKLKFWKGLRLGLIVRLIKMTMLYRSGVMLWKTELYKKEPHLKVLKYLNPNWSQITPTLQNLPRFSILDRIIRYFRGFIVWTFQTTINLYDKVIHIIRAKYGMIVRLTLSLKLLVVWKVIIRWIIES